MADFLGDLAGQISSQFSLGENTNHTLDSIDPETGKTEKYGSLGDFSKHFDQSSERRYVEEGYLRRDPYNTDPKQFEILMQEPNATVFIKKKMFSSVGDNFRPDFMSDDEKLYYKTMKVLFQNKCKQISALEKLSKIQKITSALGSVPDQMMPIIFSLGDTIRDGMDTGSSFGGVSTSFNGTGKSTQFLATLDKIRRVYAFNTTSAATSWITDSTNLFKSQFGEGTGVIEISNFSGLNTATTTDLNSPGSFGLNISDPYESMLITEYDIEKAISDATNMFYNKKMFQFAKENSATLINDLQGRLNHIRSLRGASPISFKINPDTLLGRRVIAILDRVGMELPFTYDSTSAEAIFSGGALGGGVTVSPEYLLGGQVAGNDGLSTAPVTFKNFSTSATAKGPVHAGADSEMSVFNRLISTIFSKLSLDANSQNSFQTMNKETNYVRRKMRFNFSGKLIIQSMDTVHIYVNSKSRFDTKLLSGLQDMFSGLGMLQNLNNTLTNLANSAGVFNPSGNVPLEIEKSVFVGSDFPNFLWSMIRGQFISEHEGTHIFGGVVQNAVDNWTNDGKFTIDVRGTDNSAYFDMGKINFKPGIDVYNGSSFDPLTPFESNFDTISGGIKGNATPTLLKENQAILGTSSTGDLSNSLVKFKLGRYAGEPVNEKHIIQDSDFDPTTGKIAKIFYAPDGLVYKWKEGIGIFTQFGSNLSVNDPSKVGNPNIAREPFAGQNIMNVLSLLISGVPYNFATYYKAGIDSGGITVDPQSKQVSANSFLQSLRTDLVKSNALWGNFIPFKNLVVDEKSYVNGIQKISSIIQTNEIINRKIQELQDVNQKAMLEGAASAFSEQSKNESPQFLPLKAKGEVLSKEIDVQIKFLHESDKDTTINQVGDDVSFDYSPFVDSGKNTVSSDADRRLLRRQLNFLTRRMSYNVRANEDKNLFIVDDFYDKDFDILAYEKSLTDGIKLYNSEFTSVRRKISHVAGLLNLEVFCDSQGHIRCRPPQYNRMPSSVFYKMMYLKQALNIQIFPQFLDDLFKDKLSVLKTRIEILEDEIRLDCAVLSLNTDDAAMFFILNNGATSNNPDSFAFISDNNGNITEIHDLLLAANPDQRDSVRNHALRTFDQLEANALSTKNIFTNAQKYSAINKSLTKRALNASGIPTTDTPDFLTNTRVDEIVKRIFIKSGQRVDKRDYLIQSDEKIVDVQIPANFGVDVFKTVQELSTKIRDRQKALKLFYSTLKNSQEFQSLDAKDGKTSSELITPGIYGNSHIPEIFEHMIEDETYDDYGLNSGKRFVIKRSQIKSISISENPPEYTAVEVQGLLDPMLSGNDLPQGLVGAFAGGGNGMTTAMAVDYDMWRMYGFKEGAPVNVPFLSDPISQCGPYASMLLSRNRKNILKGTVTISGNEFMQPGEVVFIEDRQLLFYVTAVRHNFTFGSTFTTSLDLSYGHTAGEYIPNVTDIIGKLIYNNRDVAELVVHRQESSANEINIGVIQKGLDENNKDSATIVNEATPDGFSTTYSAANSQVINQILYQTKYLINANSSAGNNVIANIELRVYCDDSNKEGDPDLIKFAESIREILIGQSHNGLNAFTVKGGNSPEPLPKEFVKEIKNPKDAAENTIINLDNKNDRRSPSQKAIDAARNNKTAKSTSGSSIKSTNKNNPQKDAIRTALFKYIVDCWVSIEAVPPQTSNGS